MRATPELVIDLESVIGIKVGYTVYSEIVLYISGRLVEETFGTTIMRITVGNIIGNVIGPVVGMLTNDITNHSVTTIHRQWVSK